MLVLLMELLQHYQFQVVKLKVMFQLTLHKLPQHQMTSSQQVQMLVKISTGTLHYSTNSLIIHQLQLS